MYAQNQHTGMISEGSCVTEDWNGCWKFIFAITGIDYIWKNKKQLFIVINNSIYILLFMYNIIKQYKYIRFRQRLNTELTPLWQNEW